jgi:S1-C subfamily serine protease
VIPFLLALLLLSSSASPADSQAKAHMKSAQNLLNANRPVEAYQEATAAVNLEPNNKKYHEKLVQIGQAASKLLEAQARDKMKTDPTAVRALLQDAVRYDPSNTSAAQELNAFNMQLIEVFGKTQQVKILLDAGKLVDAQTILDSIAPYAALVPAVDVVRKSAAAEEHVNRAEAFWNSRNILSAFQELQAAESVSIRPQYVSVEADSLRKKLSGYYLEKIPSGPAKTPREVISAAHSVNQAIEVYPTNSDALNIRDHVVDSLDHIFPNLNGSEQLTATAARVGLAEASLIEEELQNNPRLASQKASFSAFAYPLIRMRLIVNSSTGCIPSFDRQFFESTINKALKPTVVLDDQKWDVAVSIRNISCSQTDVPRQLEKTLNSTYVAGQTQLTNPQYIQLLNQAQQLQAEIAQLQVQNQNNPNFGTGLALGLAQGRLRRVQNALAATPPYINQDINQQYQYTQFTAYRSFQISSGILFSSSDGSKQAIDDEKIEALRENQAEGTSGILPEDHSKEYAEKLSSSIRQSVSKYLAMKAKGQKDGAGMDALGYFLYAADMAKGTPSEKLFEPAMISAKATLLNGEKQIQAFKMPSDVPALSEVDVSDSRDQQGLAQPDIESFIEGVVSIETDSGQASGFFITSSCLVLTNNHVVSGADTIVIRTSLKRLLVGRVLEHDSRRDLALLTVGAHGCHNLKIGDPGQTRVGQEVYAIGNPIGLSNTVTKGIISAYRSAKDGVRYIQLDATINPGNSGGPLMTRTGEVVGINTFKVSGYEGLNFAIAATEIKEAFRSYIQ